MHDSELRPILTKWYLREWVDNFCSLHRLWRPFEKWSKTTEERKKVNSFSRHICKQFNPWIFHTRSIWRQWVKIATNFEQRVDSVCHYTSPFLSSIEFRVSQHSSLYIVILNYLIYNALAGKDTNWIIKSYVWKIETLEADKDSMQKHFHSSPYS